LTLAAARDRIVRPTPPWVPTFAAKGVRAPFAAALFLKDRIMLHEERPSRPAPLRHILPRVWMPAALATASALLPGCAAAAPSASTPAASPAAQADTLPPGLREGPHDVVVNGVRL
jgi:hypothetical protein